MKKYLAISNCRFQTDQLLWKENYQADVWMSFYIVLKNLYYLLELLYIDL
jgi:hypothetical protein